MALEFLLRLHVGKGVLEGATMPLGRSLALLLLAATASCSVSSRAPSPADGATPSPEPAPVEQTEQDAPPNALAVDVDALFASATEKDAFSGTVVVVDGGEIVLEKAYGLADRETERPNAVDTIFRVGSVSKQFTAAAALALVEDGELDTRDPVSKHLPEYPQENLEKDGAEVTVHDLLAQTSGLPSMERTTYFQERAFKGPIDKAELLAAISAQPLVRKPGAAFEYANVNYFVLAVVVERASGKSFEAYLRDRVLEPIGMTDTGAALPASKEARAAVGYAPRAGGYYALSKQPGFADPDLTLVFGAGQLYSTVRDLALWDRALASGKVLPRTQARFFQPNLGGYGYGWVISEKDGVTIQWHNGALSPVGFSALVARVPEKDRMVAFLANVDVGVVDPLVSKLVKRAAAK